MTTRWAGGAVLAAALMTAACGGPPAPPPVTPVSAGKEMLSIPDWASVEVAVTVKLPVLVSCGL